MSMTEVRRAVLIEYSVDGVPRYGSGLHVGGGFVLTADHCARGSGHEVFVDGKRFSADVHVRSEDPTVDLALLACQELPSVDPRLRCARIDRTVVGDVACIALGFPQWKKSGSRALLAQVNGYIPTAEGVDPKAAPQGGESLTLKVANPQVRDPWNGMSGAAVLTDTGDLVAVVTSHRHPEGMRSLTLTPIEAISVLPEEIQAAFGAGFGGCDFSRLPAISTTRSEVYVQLWGNLVNQDAVSDTYEDIQTDPGRHSAQAVVAVSNLLDQSASESDHIGRLASRLTAMFAVVDAIPPGIVALPGSLADPGDVTVIDTRRGNGASFQAPRRRESPPGLLLPATPDAVGEGVPRMWILRPTKTVTQADIVRELDAAFAVESGSIGSIRLHPAHALSGAYLAQLIGVRIEFDGPRVVGRVSALEPNAVLLDVHSESERTHQVKEWWQFDVGASTPSPRDDLDRLQDSIRQSIMKNELRKGGFVSDRLEIDPRGIEVLARAVRERLALARQSEVAKAMREREIEAAFD